MGNLSRALLLLWPILNAALVITEAAGWTALGNWVFARLLAVGLPEAGAALLTLGVVIGFAAVPCLVAIIWGIFALLAGRLGVTGGLNLQGWEARKVGLWLLLATPAVGAVVLLLQLVVIGSHMDPLAVGNLAISLAAAHVFFAISMLGALAYGRVAAEEQRNLVWNHG